MNRKIGIVLLIIACLLGSAAVGRWVVVSPLLFLLFSTLVVLIFIFFLEWRLGPAGIIGLVIVFIVLLPPIPTSLGKLYIRGGDVLLLVAVLAHVLPAFLFRARGSMTAEDTDWVLVLLFSMTVVTLVSMIWGVAVHNVTLIRGDFFEYIKIGEYFIAYWLASQVRLDMRRLDNLLSLFFAVAMISFIMAWLQVTQIVPGVTDKLTPLYVVGGDSVQDILYAERRGVGTFGNPNAFGLFVAIAAAFPFAQILHRNDLPRARRGFYILIAIASVTATGLTASRTAGVALAVLFLYFSVSRNRDPQAKLGRRLLLLLVLIGIAVAFYMYILPEVAPGVASRWAAASEVTDYSTLSRRTFIWRDVISVIKLSPLLGYGPAELQYNLTPHNEFLHVVLHYGLFGIAVYVALWWHLYAKGRRLVLSGDSVKIAFGGGLQATVMVCLVFALTANAFYLPIHMTLVSILAGLAQSLLRQRNVDCNRTR